MSLLKNSPLFNSLITFSKKGVEVASYVQIRNAITTRYKQLYGDDIDLSTSTADGQYIEMMSLIINNTLQSVKSMYSNLDVETAQGKFLDMLCSLTNVTRKPAQNSTASLTVTLTELNSLVVGPSYLGGQVESIEFLDKNGTEWSYKPTNSVTTFEKDQPQTIVVVCTTAGPVRADAQWIDRVMDASILMTVNQTEPAEIGKYEETDAQLRARRIQTLGMSGITVLQSLNASLMSLAGIEDVKIYNNDSNSVVTAKDGTELQGHSVYVIIRKSRTTVLSKELIGSSLYEKMTPGIQFTMPGTEEGQSLNDGDGAVNGIAREYLYVQRIQGVPIEAGVNQYARWKEAIAINPTIVITLKKLSVYDASRVSTSPYAQSTSTKIADAVIQYMNELSISDNAKPSLIQMQAQLADPLFRGLPTFIINSVTVNGVALEYKNEDTFYHYSTANVVEGANDTVTITIS